MSDQADVLRTKMSRSLYESQKLPSKIIAVASGKGGVGKSTFTLNFSLSLQKAGKKSLIIDLDVGMGNIDILLGRTSCYSIADMVNHELSIWSVIEKGPEGLSYISGGSGLEELFEMDFDKTEFFCRQIESLESEFDYIFFDMGAGLNSNSRHFLLSAHELFLITTPEPTSVTDAYGMIKFVHLNAPALPVYMVVNRVQSREDGEKTSRNLGEVTKRFLGKEIKMLAYVPEDKIVWKAVREQLPFVLSAPSSRTSYSVNQSARTYLAQGTFSREDDGTSVRSFLAKLKTFIKKQRG
ncbi:MinD/ParA family protein [Salipaludibacillus sp. CUR1]|uniref:MinD/ParA family protein n=1 Tax=Salipaludibacillus sp. CUR1 TaxID=2820003 RepID=UPI001E2ECDCE|nr:MinD/ParA family protein [Salipaludibacillus sp. CUR1]